MKKSTHCALMACIVLAAANLVGALLAGEERRGARVAPTSRTKVAPLQPRPRADVAPNAAPVRVLQGPGTPTLSLEWHPDGRQLASLHPHDKTVYLWDAATGRKKGVLQIPGGWGLELRWTHRGLVLASWEEEEGTIGLWDLAPGKQAVFLRGHTGAIKNVAWSPDAKRLASWSIEDMTLRLWDTATGRPLKRIDLEHVPDRVAWGPNGKTLAAASEFDHVWIWDMDSGEVIHRLQDKSRHTRGPDQPRPINWSPDGKHLAFLGPPYPEWTIRLWNAAADELALVLLLGDEPAVWSIAWSPDGKRLAWDVSRGVCVWNTAGRRREHVFETDEAVLSVKWSPEGKFLAAGCEDGTVVIWNLQAARR